MFAFREQQILAFIPIGKWIYDHVWTLLARERDFETPRQIQTRTLWSKIQWTFQEFLLPGEFNMIL